MEALQVPLFFGLFLVFAVLERVLRRRTTPPRRRRRWPANLAMMAIALATLSILPVSFVTAARWAEVHGWGVLHWIALPAAATVLVTLLIRAFVSFGTHWAMHHIPALWRVHRVHHLDTELDVSTTTRFHPAELAIGLVPGVLVVIAFGLDPWVLAVYELLDIAVTLFSHADVRLPRRVERALRPLIVTPELHRIHHSTWQPETDSNFSAVFPIWDRVFGTYRDQPRAPHETMPLGLDEVRDDRADRVGWLLGSPVRALRSADVEARPARDRDPDDPRLQLPAAVRRTDG